METYMIRHDKKLHPAAPARLIQGKKGQAWEVTCPFCGAKHKHAAGRIGEDAREHLGLAVALCIGRKKLDRYVLVEEAEWTETIKKANEETI